MFSIEYQKGWDNVATDALSSVTSKLDAEIMKSILDGVNMGMMKRVDAQDLAVAKADKEIHQQVQETVILTLAAQAGINLHVTEEQDLKHLLGDDIKTEEGKLFSKSRRS